jgi:threonine aldolase
MKVFWSFFSKKDFFFEKKKQKTFIHSHDRMPAMVHAPSRPLPGMPPVRVNLYSDTQTRPSVAMKEAMMAAETGDEQGGLDPTIDQLCERMAALLGTEAAVFLPSGTMCNQISLLVHCAPGDAILAHKTAHILTSEGGGTSALSGAQIMPLEGENGQFTPETLREAIWQPTRNAPPQTLVEVEQTANLGGGTVWPLANLRRVAEIAHAHGMSTHMDGARLLNATVAAGIAPSDMVAGFDSVWLDFTKGLGAPLGAVLCGSAAFIDKAWRWKQRLGGALRQGGICAAACLYALDHNVDRLAEDHTNAATLARGLAQLEGITVQAPQTNLVFFDTKATGRTAGDIATELRHHGVMVSTMGKYRGRACTHLDVDAAGIETALDVFRTVLAA